MTAQTDCFLLTANGRDRNGRFEITLYAATAQGAARITVTNFRPLFFIPRATPAALTAMAAERKVLALKAMDGTEVDCLYFTSQYACNEAAQRLRHLGIRVFESDVSPVERYLMERGVKGGFTLTEADTPHGGLLRFQNPHLRGAAVDIPLAVLSLDIETSVSSGAIYCIGLHGKRDIVFMVGAGEPGETLEYCADEKMLLQRFFSHLKEEDPDVIIGWNVIQFDLAVIQKRCEVHRVPFELGREPPTRILLADGPGRPAMARVPGRVVLDMPTMLRNQFQTFEHYSLEAVASELLGEHKQITATGAEKIAEIDRLFAQDKPALAAYNLQDAVLTTRVFEKANILPNAIARSRLSGHLLDRVGGSIAAFDYLYLPLLHRQGYVAGDITDAPQPSEPLRGGYVMESRPGIFENVLVLDFKSLYPTIILTFAIDPLGFIAANRESSISGPSGVSFGRQSSILPHIISELLEARGQARTTRNAPLAQAIKILMNSFYGVLGATSCRFFAPQLAEAITATGRYILTNTIDRIQTTTPYTVIYGDTDSFFVLLGPDLQEQAQSIGAKLAADITAWLVDHLKQEFDATSALELKFETHFRYFFMPALRGTTTGSKKRYCGAVETNGELSLTFKGLESARTDWTDLAKDFQHELYLRVFRKQPVERFILDTVQKVRAGQLDHKLVYRKGVRKSLEEYTDHVPPHIQAARLLSTPPSSRIAYVITTKGPQPLEKLSAPLDYEHYVTTQLQPVADAILEWIGLDFETIVSGQTSLF